MSGSAKEYQEERDFRKTDEPAGEPAERGDAGRDAEGDGAGEE